MGENEKQSTNNSDASPDIERSFAPSDVELDTDAEPELPAVVGQRRKRKFIIIGAVALIIRHGGEEEKSNACSALK